MAAAKGSSLALLPHAKAVADSYNEVAAQLEHVESGLQPGLPACLHPLLRVLDRPQQWYLKRRLEELGDSLRGATIPEASHFKEDSEATWSLLYVLYQGGQIFGLHGLQPATVGACTR